MRKSKNLIIFDLDGTLVDSLSDIASSLNMVRNSFKLEDLPRNQVRGCIGDGVGTLIRCAFEDTGVDEAAALKHFLDVYGIHLLDNTRPFDGIPDLLNWVTENGFLVGVLSNKTSSLSRRVVNGIEALRKTMTFVFGGDSFSERKPSPVPLNEIVREWGSPDGLAVMIGDSPSDVQCGKAAGIRTIGAGYGFVDRERLIKACPDACVETPAGIRGVLERFMKK